MTRTVALVALTVLAGCTDRPEVTAVNADPDSPSMTEVSLGTAGLNAGITALKDAWDAAWAAKDARAFAANYTVRADFVTPLGGVLAGREAIRAQHEFLFNGPFAGSVSTTEVRRAVFLDSDVRLVDLDVTLTGYAGPIPGLPEFEPGVVRTRVKWVVVARKEGWKILAQQITAVLPAP
jgi:uncharacterized protein (TIGR02246 family)